MLRMFDIQISEIFGSIAVFCQLIQGKQIICYGGLAIAEDKKLRWPS